MSQKSRREMAPLQRVVLAGLAITLAVGAGAKDEWKKKPAAQWTQAEVEEFLRKSPWAKEVELWQFTGRTTRETVRQRRETYSDAAGEAPVTVSSATQTVTPELVSAKYRVWWTSAGLARQAWERLRELNPALAEQDAPPEASAAHCRFIFRGRGTDRRRWRGPKRQSLSSSRRWGTS